MNRTEHLLTCLAEECAEVQHAVAKALRFGLDDGYPGSASTNAQDIAREFADVLAVVEMLEEAGALERQTDTHAIERKKARVSEYMTYAEQCGTLTPNALADRREPIGEASSPKGDGRAAGLERGQKRSSDMTFDDHWTKVLSFNPALAENPFLRPLAEAAWNAAAVAEREACARIVVARAAKVGHRALPATVGEACATSILARSNDRVEGRDAASSRRVPSHDGLCGNGSEVGGGDTAAKSLASMTETDFVKAHG